MGSISEAIIEMTEAEVTRKVTKKVREEVTRKVTKEVTKKVREENRKAFSKRLMKLIDDKVLTISEAAAVLDISEEKFMSYIE